MKKRVLGEGETFGDGDFLDRLADQVPTAGERLTEVPLSKLREKENVRVNYENVEALAESIREQGLLQPVQVLRAADGFYDLLIGHRRFRAYLLLSKKHPGEYTKIKALVRETEGFNPEEVVVLQLAENLQREGLSPLELRDALQKLRERGKTHREIAALIGKSEGHVSHLFATVNTLDANPELEALLRTDASVSIGLADLQEVRPLPPRLQVQVIAERAAGSIKNREELRERVRALKDEDYEAGREKRRERASQPLLAFDDRGRLRLRAVVCDLAKSTTEERQTLMTALREALSRLEAAS